MPALNRIRVTPDQSHHHDAMGRRPRPAPDVVGSTDGGRWRCRLPPASLVDAVADPPGSAPAERDATRNPLGTTAAAWARAFSDHPRRAGRLVVGDGCGNCRLEGVPSQGARERAAPRCQKGAPAPCGPGTPDGLTSARPQRRARPRTAPRQLPLRSRRVPGDHPLSLAPGGRHHLWPPTDHGAARPPRLAAHRTGARPAGRRGDRNLAIDRSSTGCLHGIAGTVRVGVDVFDPC